MGRPLAQDDGLLPADIAVRPAAARQVALAVAIGVAVGFLAITRACGVGSADGAGVTPEAYAVLAGTLYSEGEDLRVVADYLRPLGKSNPGAFILEVADRYGRSSDRSKQHDAEDLRQLGQALVKGSADTAGQPAPRPTLAPSGTAAITPSAGQSSAPPPPQAVIKSPQGDGIRLRTEPSTAKGSVLGLLAPGARVEILDVVEGQLVEGGEKRWYKIRSGQTVGYVYFLYVVPAD